MFTAPQKELFKFFIIIFLYKKTEKTSSCHKFLVLYVLPSKEVSIPLKVEKRYLLLSRF